MPRGLKRYQQAESLHFITFSCYHRLPFLSEPEPKNILETQLERTRNLHDACIYAYVFMPEHVDILINEAGGPLIILGAPFIRAADEWGMFRRTLPTRTGPEGPAFTQPVLSEGRWLTR